MNFLEIKSRFESQIDNVFNYELLELRYVPYAFGSGLAAYRIKGRNVKLVFDGKDEIAKISITSKHTKYPSDNESIIFTGSYSELFNNLKEIMEGINKYALSLLIYSFPRRMGQRTIVCLCQKIIIAN